MADDDAPTTTREHKRALRAAARAGRQGADPAARSAAAGTWTAQLLGLDVVAGARTVAAYASYGTEPPTDDLVATLAERGVRVLLPVLRDDRDLDWTEAGSDGATLGVDAVTAADVVVVPALRVGLDGARLGQGGGSYDRALARVAPGTPVVALVHDDEVVPAGAVPSEAHDHPVTHVVTPVRALRVGHRHAHLHPHPDNPIPIDPDAPAADRDRRWDVALVVALGGALGSLARWGLNEAVPHGARGFPWATFLENVSGCLVLGVLMVFLLDVWRPTRYGRPFLAVGVLGGYTTFSTYTVDTRGLLDHGEGLLALTYFFGTLALGLVATWLGLAAGRAVAGVPQRSLRARTGGDA